MSVDRYRKSSGRHSSSSSGDSSVFGDRIDTTRYQIVDIDSQQSLLNGIASTSERGHDQEYFADKSRGSNRAPYEVIQSYRSPLSSPRPSPFSSPPSYEQAIENNNVAHNRKRLVNKNGSCNVIAVKVSSRKMKFLTDIFTTLIDLKWKYNLLIFTLAFVITWFVFAFFYWLIMFFHDDDLHVNDESWESCMDNVNDFPSALMFSVDTQETIGYGSRAIRPTCPHAIVTFMVQSCVGVLSCSLVAGLVFAKISRPKPRSLSVQFSKQAVICMRNGVYNLMFRIGDVRKSHIVETAIRAILIRNRVTTEGEVIPLCQVKLKLATEMTKSKFAFLVWPITVVHRIDNDSPLWDLTEEKLRKNFMEIVVIFEGVVEVSGRRMQVRTSYVPDEIAWGFKFATMFRDAKRRNRFNVDYAVFDTVLPSPMQGISASVHSKQSETARTSRHRRPTMEAHLEEDEEMDMSIDTGNTIELSGVGNHARHRRKT